MAEDLWSPLPNPLASRAADDLYMAGARALQRLWAEIRDERGLPERPPESQLPSVAGEKPASDAGRHHA